ncbi:MAG: carboxypeptidase-like regulatory domain-containing protein [Chloroflexota bacterium]
MFGKPYLRILIVLACGLTLLMALASASALGSLPAWGVVTSPNQGSRDNALYGIAAVSSNDIWVVGDWNPNVPPTETGRRTLAQHWDGVNWQIVTTPDPSWSGMDYATLQDVAAVATNDVWAMGYSEDFASLKSETLIQHWDGTAWTIVASPNPGGSNLINKLRAVAAVGPSDVWAVGGGGYPERAMILHWDGVSWSAVNNRCRVPLYGVTVVSATDIWAVGDNTTCRYNGVSWQRVNSPQPRPAYSEVSYSLRDVDAVATNDMWAAGSRVLDYGKYLVNLSFFEHWNGSNWTRTLGAPGQIMYGVAAVSTNDVWAVGTSGFGPLILHWDGVTWDSVPTPSEGSGGSLQAIDALAADELWAAGYYYDDTFDEQTLIEQAPSTTSGNVVGDTNVAGAVVTWIGLESGSATTDAFGEYEAAGLLAGAYTFIASYGGCTPDSATVVVTVGLTINQDFQLDC